MNDTGHRLRTMFTRMFNVISGDLDEKKKTRVTWDSDGLIGRRPEVREVPDVKRWAACPVSSGIFQRNTFIPLRLQRLCSKELIATPATGAG